MCVCTHEPSALGGHKRVLDPLKVELQAVLSCPTQVLGAKLKSPGRAVPALTAESSLWSLEDRRDINVMSSYL